MRREPPGSNLTDTLCPYKTRFRARGEGVADVGALVEAETPDDAIGEADRDEAVFELAGLVLGADEDGGVVEAGARACGGLDLLADAAGLLGAVPDADDADLVAGVGFGPQEIGRAHV